jgi:hypothetical protein
VDATDGCHSGQNVLATINPYSTITATTANNRCGTGTVTLGAAASARQLTGIQSLPEEFRYGTSLPRQAFPQTLPVVQQLLAVTTATERPY